MEGPNIRGSPRLALGHPVELRVGRRIFHIKRVLGNLSAGGLYVRGQKVPVNTALRVKIGAFEAAGLVRFAEPWGGVGIEFIGVTQANRKHLDDLIEQITREEGGRVGNPRPKTRPRRRARRRQRR